MRLLISDAFAADAPATAPVTMSEQSPLTPEEMAAVVSPQKMMMDTLFFLLLLFTIFYFILIRPQQKRIKAHQEMVGALQKGTKVVTGGGILGTVVKVESDDVVLVEIAPNVKVRIAKATIQEIVKGGAAADIANDN